MSSSPDNTYLIVFAIINSIILIVTVVAVWRAPILAVRVGQRLQTERRESDRLYQNKFIVFATILGNRHAKGFNENFVIAVNQIPIIFSDSPEVLAALDRFITTHRDTNPRPAEIINQNLNAHLNDLVLSMANNLGYNNVNNDVMTRFFYPDASYFSHEAADLYNLIYVNLNRDKRTSSQA